MNTKLILIEGLPGNGKSTTAKSVYDILIERNIDAQLFLEGNPEHPADYESVACFTEEEFHQLLKESGKFETIFKENVMYQGEYYLLPYGKIINDYDLDYSDEVFKRVFKNDIYEMPFDQNVELITNKWNDFAESALKDNKVYIFECCFIQNPVTVGMIKYNEPNEKVINYIMKLAQIIEKLNPMLLYIEQDDLEYTFKKAIKERSQDWSDFFIDYYTNQGYGKEHNYSGVEGTIKVLEARRDFELEIFDQLNMNKEKLNNTKYEIDSHRSMLQDLLTLQIVKLKS